MSLKFYFKSINGLKNNRNLYVVCTRYNEGGSMMASGVVSAKAETNLVIFSKTINLKVYIRISKQIFWHIVTFGI